MPIIRWLDRNVERVVILVSYTVMASIVFVEVIRRFTMNEQEAWSSTIPVYLFLWIVWAGCTYNVRIRTHLRFDELRVRFSYTAQFACLMLDAVLWIVFSAIVIYFTVQQVQLAYDNFAIVQGTDDVMQWWFYLATPLAFSLLIVRVLQNVYEDVAKYRRGEEFEIQTSILGD